MKKPNGASPRTHFEQVPVEVVKKILDKDVPRVEKPTPVPPLRTVRTED